MFCPKCATQNLEGASFCRTCGANISLVPQALAGQMVQPQRDDDLAELYRRRRRHRREPTLESAFKSVFMGIAFLIIAIALSETIGETWWFWMLIPAFSLMGKGVAQFVRVREKQKQAALAPPRVAAPPQVTAPSFTRATDELRPPVPSVTEGTTRHLGVEAETRQLETQERK